MAGPEKKKLGGVNIPRMQGQLKIPPLHQLLPTWLIPPMLLFTTIFVWVGHLYSLNEMERTRTIQANLASMDPVVHEQTAGTCYAHASALIIEHATKRVVRRCYPNSQELANEIIFRFGSHGGSLEEVLRQYCPQFGLSFQVIDASSAISAVRSGRWVLAAFRLTAGQWRRFSFFCRSFPHAILKKTDLDPPLLYAGWPQAAGGEWQNITAPSTEYSHGHAVVLTSVQDNKLTFRNSWGKSFGANGNFQVEKADTLGNMDFYDVFPSVEGEVFKLLAWLLEQVNNPRWSPFFRAQATSTSHSCR